MRNERWASWTCTVGWAVQGIYNKGSGISSINSLARSPDSSSLATVDEFGFVNLFKNPCPVETAIYNKSTGHSREVSNLGFTQNSTGS